MLSAPDFAYVTQLLLSKAAIRIDATQEYLVRSRLEPLAKQAGLPDLTALVEQLRQKPFGDLHTRVVEAMTTNETSFFRDNHPFETLKALIIPELVNRKVDRTLRVWSAACSTGQEPYSLAMLLSSADKLKGWKFQIVATDFARMPLEKAQSGIYTALEVGRGLPARMLAEHFDRVGTSYQVKSHLRSMIEWRQMNLGGQWSPMPMFDVIFMRNVLIYFEQNVVISVLHRARACLQNYGALFLGNTENMLGLHASFESHTNGRTIFYRPTPSTGRKSP
jgi:chemotaxis protein methyltransferase CheR